MLFFSSLQAVPRIMVQSASIDTSAARIKQVSTLQDMMIQFSYSHTWKPEVAEATAGLAI